MVSHSQPILPRTKRTCHLCIIALSPAQCTVPSFSAVTQILPRFRYPSEAIKLLDWLQTSSQAWELECCWLEILQFIPSCSVYIGWFNCEAEGIKRCLYNTGTILSPVPTLLHLASKSIPFHQDRRPVSQSYPSPQTKIIYFLILKRYLYPITAKSKTPKNASPTTIDIAKPYSS